MALPIPFVTDWPGVQQALDFIAQRFPLSKRDLSNEVLNGYLKLFTQADVKLKMGAVADVFAGNVAANAEASWNPTAADLGLTTLTAAVLGLVPNSTATGVRVQLMIVYPAGGGSPRVRILNGATPQTFDGSYLALGT